MQPDVGLVESFTGHEILLACSGTGVLHTLCTVRVGWVMPAIAAALHRDDAELAALRARTGARCGAGGEGRAQAAAAGRGGPFWRNGRAARPCTTAHGSRLTQASRYTRASPGRGPRREDNHDDVIVVHLTTTMSHRRGSAAQAAGAVVMGAAGVAAGSVSRLG